MDFTREPIIQTIITPKEGCKLVIRSSKNAGQEEYFVDAVEVVSFDNASFFRSLERPKPFLVPISDYEILEVREARMVLKSVGIDRSIKIGGGRESISRGPKGSDKEISLVVEPTKVEGQVPAAVEGPGEVKAEARPGLEKKRDRRRQYRKRRGGQLVEKEEGAISGEPTMDEGEEEKITYPVLEEQLEAAQPSGTSFSSLLQPPPTLISETINRYRENALFKSAFFLSEEEQYKPHDKVEELLNDDEEFSPALQEPVYADADGLPERSFDAIKEVQEETSFNEVPEIPYSQPTEEDYQAECEFYQPVEEYFHSTEELLPKTEAIHEEERQPQPIEEFVEQIKPVEEFEIVKEEADLVEQAHESIEQPLEESQERVLEDQPLDTPISFSLFQEEDDEKFNEKSQDESDHEKK